MTLLQRIVAGCTLALVPALFWYAPDLLALDTPGLVLRSAIVQLGGPLLAAIGCVVASRGGSEAERTAWRSFAIGSSLYFLGNVGYMALAIAGTPPDFPSFPEAAFFLMAGFFAFGMLRYTQLRRRFSIIQLYNFALIYCAVAMSTVFVLNHSIAASVMPPVATIVAFLYPALWFTVAAFGVVSLVLYTRGRKTVPYGLLVLALLAEAVADFRYALQLMQGTYEMGGVTQLLWVVSAGLIVFAALEQAAANRRADNDIELVRARPATRGIAQAIVPAAAVGAVLLSGAVAGVIGDPAYSAVAAILAIGFALIAGFREHWIINTQRQLRHDVEDSRRQLEASQRQLVAVLESTEDSVLVVDRDWKVTYFNRHAARMIGRATVLQIGASLWELFPPEMKLGEDVYYKRAAATGQPEVFDLYVPAGPLWLGISAYPTEDGLSIFFRDITEQKRVRDEIVHLAHHDALTGLANRTLFQQRLREAAEAGNSMAVLLLDLDHFKEVNDTLGHPVGDALLINMAARLRACLGDEATIARLGGDEFAAILSGHDGENEIAMIAMRLIEAAEAPHQIDGHAVRVAASVGIAVPSGEPVPDELLKDADVALYAAKTEARGAFRFFEPSMHIELMQKQRIRSDLAGALERGEFCLTYEPQIDLHTNRVSGFEALLRWHHPRRGVVSPDEFVPVAEETGMIGAIGEWVLRQACLRALQWPDNISIAVNLSPRQFATDDLAGMVESALHDTGLSPSRLELEITETVLLRDTATNMLILRRLRALGVSIALDDFGTGFSSLGYLQRFPFSKIKIDRTFIAGLPSSEESQAIVRSVMGLGKSLGLRIVAEGVETEAQLDWIRNGCDEAQGFLLSEPVLPTDIPRTIARLNAGVTERVAV